MSVVVEEVQLKDGISGPAKTAAGNVESLKHKMTVLQSALKSTQDQMIKAQAAGNTKQYAALLKSSEQYKAALGQLDQQLNAVGGSSVGMQSELAALTGGLSVVVAALGAVGLAFGAAVFAGAKFAIECSEAKNAALSLWTALGSGRISGEQVDDMLDDMRGKLGVTKDAMAPFVTEFLKMGITGKDVLQDLTTAAMSAEALVKGGGDAFTKLTRQVNAAAESGQKLKIPYKKFANQLSEMGLNIDDVAKKMNMTSNELTSGLKAGTVDAQKLGDAVQNALTDKGAGPLETMGLSVKNLGGLFKEYIGDMFEDLGPAIKPFLKEVKSLFGIFDSKTKPSGQALKEGIEGFFKKVFAIATKVVPMVKHFLLDVIIFGLKAYIALKPLVKSFQEWTQSADGAAKIQSAITLVKEALTVLAVIVGVVVAGILLFVGAAIAVQVAIVALGLTIINFTTKAISALGDWVTGAAEAAKNFVLGLVNGITSGADSVVSAVKGLGEKAKGAFKASLGIASPSKEMMKLGAFAGAGVSEGLDKSAGDVKVSAKALGAEAFGGAASGGTVGGNAPAPASGGKSGLSVIVEAGAIIIQGAGKGVEELTEEAVSLLFERVALENGLG